MARNIIVVPGQPDGNTATVLDIGPHAKETVLATATPVTITGVDEAASSSDFILHGQVSSDHGVSDRHASDQHLSELISSDKLDAAHLSSDLREQHSSSDAHHATSWNPFDKAAPVVLSDTNHLASLGTFQSQQNVRGSQGHNTGKYYFELIVPVADQNNQFSVYGLATGAVGLNADPYHGLLGFNGIILGEYGGGGHFTMTNNVIQFAVDFTTNTLILKAHINSGAFSTEWIQERLSAAPGPLWYPFAAFNTSSTAASCRVEMGDRGFTYPIPDGYQAWGTADVGGSGAENVLDSIIIAAVTRSGGNGNHGIIRTSDGVDWTVVGTPNNSNGSLANYSVLGHSPQLNKFVAIAPGIDSATKQIITSADGVVWAQHTSPQLSSWNDVCWSDELRLFVAVSADGTNRVMTSPDGSTWTLRASADDSVAWQSVAWSPYAGDGSSGLGLFVATGTSGKTMISPDGVHWSMGTTLTAQTYFKIIFTGTKLVACANSATATLVESTDGFNWTGHNIGSTGNIATFCYSPDLDVYLLGATTGLNGLVTYVTGAFGVTTGQGPSDTNHIWHAFIWSRAHQCFYITEAGTAPNIYTSPTGLAGSWQIIDPTNTAEESDIGGTYGFANIFEGIIFHETLSSELDSMFQSDARASSDKLLHDAASSDAQLAGGLSSDAAASSDKHHHDAVSSDHLLSEAASSSDADLSSQHHSDKLAHDAASSSDKPAHDAASSDAGNSSEKAIHDAHSSDHNLSEQASSQHLIDEQASSSNKPGDDQASSAFQSFIENEPAPPIQVVVIVS